MATITQSMLRRFASRSLDVLDRHKDSAGAIAAFQSSLGVTALAYAQAFDAAQQAQASWTRVINSRSGAVLALNEALQSWLPLLRRDVEGIAGRQFGGVRAVVTDAINDVTHLLQLVEAYAAETEEPVDYLDSMRAELLAARAGAQAELDASGASASRVKGLQDETRRAAAAFRVDLVTFRAVIRVVLGRAHPDYRQLRSVDRRGVEEPPEQEAADPTASASLRVGSGGTSDPSLELDGQADAGDSTSEGRAPDGVKAAS